MTRILRFVAMAAMLMMQLAGAVVLAAAPPLETRTGVVVTPRNFPHHTAADLDDMFKLNAELGSFAVIRINWKDDNRAEAARALMTFATRHGLETVLELNPFKADELKGADIDAPKDVAPRAKGRLSFTDAGVRDAFSRAVVEFAQLKPAYLAVATDVNLYGMSDAAGMAGFVELYGELVARIKQVSPRTKVFVTFQWDAMQREAAAAQRRWIDAFGAQLDLLAMTSEPRKLYADGGPGALPRDYYARISALAGRPLFLDVNWPSNGGSGEADQVSFIRALPAHLATLKPAMLAWTFLHDVKVLVFTVRAGLLESDGKAKPAFEAFKALASDRPAARPASAAAAVGTVAARAVVGTETASREAALFGIYTARLDGSDVHTLMTSADREMTHPRVSPDGKRIVLTRYNEPDDKGHATEDRGYENTEIMIMNLDGTGLETIIAPKPGVIAANGCWTPDGKALIFISTDNRAHEPRIMQVDLATRRISRLPTPSGLKTTDPHWEGNQLVFPAKGEGADALWVMDADGKRARQVTHPVRTASTAEMSGDFDPKLSPDGSHVAFMRIDGGNRWRVMTLDLASGEEHELTPKGVIEGLPTWSSDGRLLLFRHIDLKKPRNIGLYTMTPDGADRKRVPLPRGYLYNHGSFFPGDGSSPAARIIYTGTENSAL